MQFVVFKFLPNNGAKSDDMFYDVGLESWITELNEDMTGKIKWPPKSAGAGNFARKEKAALFDWLEEPILVKRFYGKEANNIFESFISPSYCTCDIIAGY